MKHRIIPVFVPELACPNQCIYCNQRIISGQLQIPTDEEIISVIERNLSTFTDNTFVELGFFGGNFTGIEIEEQQRLFSLIKPYRDRGVIKEVRLSTRPDYINREIIDFLVENGVNTVELGVQSLDEEVLSIVQRGYTSSQVYDAARLIRQAGIKLGMQMMVGLPGDTPEKSLMTAEKIVEWGAENTRIYPTLVIQNTELASWYKTGKYKPLLLGDALHWVKPILYLFETRGVSVLRVGLHPTEGFIDGKDYMAGPFHVSFKELVQTLIWNDLFDKDKDGMFLDKVRGQAVVVEVPAKQINAAIGHYAKNKEFILNKYGVKPKFVSNSSLPIYTFSVQ